MTTMSLVEAPVIALWHKAGAATPRPESLELRVLDLLAGVALSKSALSSALGPKEVSGHLNQVVRVLLAEQTVEYTIPEKPNSRLQQYRITEKGIALLAELRKGKAP
jgi:ATP-dependent DNA helicase RecG